jgi:hypothetical protein
LDRGLVKRDQGEFNGHEKTRAKDEEEPCSKQ